MRVKTGLGVGLKSTLAVMILAVVVVSCGGTPVAVPQQGDPVCTYSAATIKNTIALGVTGLTAEVSDRDSQSAKVSWGTPLPTDNKVVLLRIQVGTGSYFYREVRGFNDVVLTSANGLNTEGVANYIDAFVYDRDSCSTSRIVKGESETSITLLSYKRVEPTLSVKPVTKTADNDGDGNTDVGVEDFTVGVGLSYTDLSPDGTNQNYTITVKRQDGSVLQNVNGDDSIVLNRVGQSTSVVLYDELSVAAADTHNGEDNTVGNDLARTYQFTSAGVKRGVILFVHTEVAATTTGGAGNNEDKFAIAPVRFRFGVSASQVFVNAVQNAPVANNGVSDESDFVYTALTPNYNSDLKDSLQLFQQSTDNAVSYSVLQLKKSASGTIYVYSNEPNQLGTNVAGCSNFVDSTTNLVDFSKITNEADETKFAACEFSKKLNIQGLDILLRTSTLSQFIDENIGRSLPLAFVLSYDLGGDAKSGGAITTADVMNAIASTIPKGSDNAIGYGNRVLSSVVYAPYDSRVTDKPVTPDATAIDTEYDDLNADGAKEAFTTFLVRTNVNDSISEGSTGIKTDARGGEVARKDLPLVGGSILTLETSKPVYLPVLADHNLIITGGGVDADGALTDPKIGGVKNNRVVPYDVSSAIAGIVDDLSRKKLFIIRDMVRPGGKDSYSDLIDGVSGIASGLYGLEPSLEAEYNFGVRGYMLRDALDNSPLRNAIELLGLDPALSSGTEPKGSIAAKDLHSYGFSSVSYSLDANLTAIYAYPAYGALVGSSTVAYDLSLTPQEDKQGADSYPLLSKTLTGKTIPSSIEQRYTLSVLTREVDGEKTTTIRTGGTIGTDIYFADGKTCNGYFLADQIDLPYTFRGDPESIQLNLLAEKFSTTIVNDKITGGICLATPTVYKNTIVAGVGSGKDLPMVTNVPYSVTAALRIGERSSFASESSRLTVGLLPPSGLRASQEVVGDTLTGIRLDWLVSPDTYMKGYEIDISGSDGFTLLGVKPADLGNTEGRAAEEFIIPNTEDRFKSGVTYTITLRTTGSAGANGETVVFPPITASVDIDLTSANVDDILNRLYDVSADVNKKTVLIAGNGFLGRPETTGNAPLGTFSAIKRARELGFGAVGFSLVSSTEEGDDEAVKASKTKLYLATGQMGVEYSQQDAYFVANRNIGRDYKNKAYYSCATINYEGRKYEYDNEGTLSDIGEGKTWPNAGHTQQGLIRDLSLTSAELDTCYARSNDKGGTKYGSDGYTNFPGYGGINGEKLIEINDDLVKLLKEQNMVVMVSLPGGQLPALQRATDLVSGESAGRVLAPAEDNDNAVRLARYKLLLTPFLKADYAQGLVLRGSGVPRNNVKGVARSQFARNNVALYLDLRYVANLLANDPDSGVTFDGAGDSIDDNIPTVVATTAYNPFGTPVDGSLKLLDGQFTEWAGGKPTAPTASFVIPEETDANGDPVKVVAYNFRKDANKDLYGTKVVLSTPGDKANGNLSLVAKGTPIKIDGVNRKFDIPRLYYNITHMDDITKLANVVTPVAPNIRLTISGSYRVTPDPDRPFSIPHSVLYKIVNTTVAMAGANNKVAYGIDIGLSGTLFYDVYTRSPIYNYDKGGYTQDPRWFDDSLGLLASGYLSSYSSTFLLGGNVLPLSLILAEFNGLANKGGKSVTPAILNTPEITGINRAGNSVSFSITEGMKNTGLLNPNLKGLDTPQIQQLYKDLYKVGADHFVGYEISVVGGGSKTIFLPTKDYTGTTAFSNADLPTSEFEIRIRAKYEIPFVDGSGNKEVYSLGRIYSIK